VGATVIRVPVVMARSCHGRIRPAALIDWACG
jgi:hypothetical protein